MIKAGNMTRSFFITPNRGLIEENHSCLNLQGNGKWDQVWEPLVVFAKAHDLAKISIDLNLAWLHEGYHATWSAIHLPERSNQVQVRWPLIAQASNQSQPINIGALQVVAKADSPQVHERIAELSLKLADLGPHIQRVIEDLEDQRPGAPASIKSEPTVASFASPESKRESAALVGRS